METEVEQHDKTQRERSENESVPTSGQAVFWVGLLIVLGLMAGGLYWLWQQQQLMQQTLEQKIIAATPAPVDISGLEQQITDWKTAITQQLETLSDAQKALTQELATVKESQQMTKADIEYHWAIKSIEYLLEVANQRVLLAQDAQGALAAITLADERIEALSDQRLFPLRDILAKEMLALKAVNVPDIAGMALQLNALINKVDSLQVLYAPPVNKGQNDTTGTMQNWQGTLEKAWQEVKSLVVIRHQQEGDAAVLVPEQRYFLYQNLKLKLEAARVALLLKQDTIYKDSLRTAQTWLSQYFIGDTRDAMVQTVTDLAQKNIKVDLPDISASLTWIRGFES